jgi:hypothetical protein
MSNADINVLINDAHNIAKRRQGRWVTTYSGLTMGWSISQGAGSSTSNSTTTAAKAVEVRNIYRQTGSGDLNGHELERVGMHEIIRLQIDDPTQDAPTRFHAERVDGNQTATNVSPIRWRLWVHPLPDATYWFSSKVLLSADALSGSSDVIQLPESGAFAVVRDAAALGARIMGRSDEFIQQIRRWNPERYDSSTGQSIENLEHNGKPAEVVR